jgi:hypothetical protein
MRTGQTFNARGDGSVSGSCDQTSGMGWPRDVAHSLQLALDAQGYAIRAVWCAYGDGGLLAMAAGKGATFASGNRCQFHATLVAGPRSGSEFIRKVVVTI